MYSLIDSMVRINSDKGAFSLIKSGNKNFIVIEYEVNNERNNLVFSFEKINFTNPPKKIAMEDDSNPVNGFINIKKLNCSDRKNFFEKLEITSAATTYTWQIDKNKLEGIVFNITQEAEKPPLYISANSINQESQQDKLTQNQWLNNKLAMASVTIPPEGDPEFISMPKLSSFISLHKKEDKALVDAIVQKDLLAIATAIRQNANLNIVVPEKWRFNVFEFFSQQQKNPQKGLTPLMIAVGTGMLEIVTMLVNAGAEVDKFIERDKKKITAMDYAIFYGNKPLIFYFYAIDAKHFTAMKALTIKKKKIPPFFTNSYMYYGFADNESLTSSATIYISETVTDLPLSNPSASVTTPLDTSNADLISSTENISSHITFTSTLLPSNLDTVKRHSFLSQQTKLDSEVLEENPVSENPLPTNKL